MLCKNPMQPFIMQGCCHHKKANKTNTIIFFRLARPSNLHLQGNDAFKYFWAIPGEAFFAHYIITEIFTSISDLTLMCFNLLQCYKVTLYVLCLFVVRLSPYETEDLDSTDGAGETPFATFHHCLWFTMASWVQQGCDFLPR